APRPGPGPASSRGSSSSCPPSAGYGCSLAVLLEDRDSRQFLALDELEARTTAGRDVREEGFVEAERTHRGGGVSTADDGIPVGLREVLGHGRGALGEALELEHAHRSVPEHGRGIGDL